MSATLGIAVVLLLAGIHARAWVFRWQARRLLNEARALEMGKTPGAEALKLKQRLAGADHVPRPLPGFPSMYSRRL